MEEIKKEENIENEAKDNQEQIKKENEALKKSKELGKQAYTSAKEASKSAFNAFIKLFINPIDKQEEVISELGSKNILSAGIVFNLLFVIFSFLFSIRVIKHIEEISYGMFEAGFFDYFKIILYSIFTIGLFILAFFFVGHFLTKKIKNIENYIFTTGIVLFPLSINFLLAAIFFNIYFLLTIISIFGICFHVLILNGSLIEVYKLSKRTSLLVIPSIFSIVYIIYYLITKL